jgi:hypothetical protein
VRTLLLFCIAFLWPHSGVSQEEHLEDRLAFSLQSFAGQSVSSLKVQCAPSRGPASTKKTISLQFQTKSGAQTLRLDSESNKVSSVALLGDFIEFSKWTTFIPEEGKFRIDTVGKSKSASELMLNSSKPNYVKALEQLAPRLLECCKQSSCRENLTAPL